jgi:hypothetical protein
VIYLVETKKVRLGDKIYIEKILYCNCCKKEILRYKKIIIFDVDKCYKNEKIETLEWLENVVCPHCNKINKSLSLDE